MTEGTSVRDYRALFTALPAALLVMTPDWQVVDANEAYLTMLGRTRDQLIGKNLFDAFPPPPDELDDEGVHPVQRTFEKARDSRRPEVMPLFEYDVEDPVGGSAVRYWSLVVAPVLDDAGEVTLVVQRAEDVTEYVIESRGAEAEVEQGRLLRERVQLMEADLYTRVQQLRAAQEAKEVAARRLASLGEVALQLTSASSVADLERIVVSEGLRVLGADGGAILTPAEDGTWRATISETLGTHVQLTYRAFAYESPTPLAWTARTGQRLVLPTVADGLAFDPDMQQVYDDTGRRGWVTLPLRARDECLGGLAVAWVEEHPVTREELDVLDGFAAQCAQALDRLQALDAERAAASAVARMSESLQRSLLTAPPEMAGLEVAVRYVPAAHEAQVGGDWYDAFVTTDGTSNLVVGDVVGHDREAAAAMAQMRNVLRGIAYALQQPPSLVIACLDRAVSDLQGATLATAVVAQVHPSAGESDTVDDGRRLLRWSSAGHPPPLLLHVDGRVDVLAAEPDLMLGVHPQSERHDHEAVLEPGDTVLLYTDGLVERRDRSLDDGLARLVRHLEGRSDVPLEELCDVVLRMPHETEDDVALLALRVDGVGARARP